MAEYIEKEELLRKRPFCVAGGLVNDYTEGFCDCVDEARETIKNMPAADVAPMVHGRWVKEPPYKSIGGEYLKALICSKCNSFFVSDGNKPWQMHNYCPNCGAMMDGEEQDDE